MRSRIALLTAAGVLGLGTIPAGAALFTDGFESGVNGSVWEVVPGTYNQILVGDSAHAFGTQSAKQVEADPWVYYMRTKTGAFPGPGLITPGWQEILTVWLWDDDKWHGGGGPQTAAGVMLSDAGGSDFYQLAVNSTKSWSNYCWRTALDGTFVSSIPRSQGWHKWQIVVNPYTGNTGDVKFYIDDQWVADAKRKYDNEMNQIRLGISIKTPGSSFWYDNVDLSMVPEPAAALLMVAAGGILLRRRRL